MANQEGTPATTEVVETPQTPEAPHDAAPVPEPKLEAAPAPEQPEPRVEAPTGKPLDSPPDLPVVFRGYERKATDSFLHRLEESFHALSAERDGLHNRIEELEHELAHHKSRSHAVADALISAQMVAGEIRTNAMHQVEVDRIDAEAAKTAALEAAAEIRSRAEGDAAETMRDAQVRADRLYDDAQRDVKEQQHEAEHILDSAKERLGVLVSDLLGRVPSGSDRHPHDG